MKLAFLDTETTSLIDGRLVQLAYETYDSDSPEKNIKLNKMYKPPVPIELEAMCVHHITETMVLHKEPFDPESVKDILEKYVFVAHNAPFDIGILVNEGCTPPKYWIDTKKISQYYLDYPKFNLQYLRYRFGLEIEADAHDAAGDVAVLRAVFFRLLLIATEEESDATILPEIVMVKKFIEISKNPLELRRFTFGKYSGETFTEVSTKDKPYLEWLRADIIKKGEPGNEDLLYTLGLYI